MRTAFPFAVLIICMLMGQSGAGAGDPEPRAQLIGVNLSAADIARAKQLGFAVDLRSTQQSAAAPRLTRMIPPPDMGLETAIAVLSKALPGAVITRQPRLATGRE